MNYNYIYIVILFALYCCLSSCTMSKQIRFINKQINQSKFCVKEDSENPFTVGIPKFRDSGYKLEIEFREQKSSYDPYVNSILIWLGGKKKPIAYWERVYCRAVTPTEDDSTQVHKQYAFDLVGKQDILMLSPRRKQLNKLLKFIVKNKTYLTLSSNNLPEKYNIYSKYPLYQYSIIIRNRTRYNYLNYDDSSSFLGEGTGYKEFTDFAQEIYLIRQAIGANPIPDWEQDLPEKFLQKQKKF